MKERQHRFRLAYLFSLLMIFLLIWILIGCGPMKRFIPSEEPAFPGTAYDWPHRPPSIHEKKTVEIYRDHPKKMRRWLNGRKK